jgi:signal transduction histidine kinase
MDPAPRGDSRRRPARGIEMTHETNGTATGVGAGGRRRRLRRPIRCPARRQVADDILMNDRRLARVREAWAADECAVLDHLTHAAARSVGTRVAAVSFVDGRRQLFKSVIGLAEPWATRRAIPLAYSFCRHAVVSGRPFIVRDARVHPLVRNNPSVRALGVIAYAGMPLSTCDGLVLGTLNVVAHEPREWTPGELDLLRDLAGAASAEIEEAIHAAAATRRESDLVSRLACSRSRQEGWVESAGHDLRQFLNVIAMGTELMLETEGRSNEEVRRHGERIVNAAARMNRLIGDLLDACREDRDAPVLATARISPARPAQQVVDDCSPVAQRRGVAIASAIDQSLPDVEADPDAIARVLSNLVTNAIKFTPAGGVITVRLESDGCGGAAFAVEDTGPGIPEEQRARVFERFWQADRRRGGLGLGLSIARVLVEAHGGRIRAEAAPGGGARIAFTVPAAAARGGAARTATA